MDSTPNKYKSIYPSLLWPSFDIGHHSRSLVIIHVFDLALCRMPFLTQPCLICLSWGWALGPHWLVKPHRLAMAFNSQTPDYRVNAFPVLPLYLVETNTNAHMNRRWTFRTRSIYQFILSNHLVTVYCGLSYSTFLFIFWEIKATNFCAKWGNSVILYQVL